MTYRELLKLYKTGKLEGPEKEQLEKEIEKQDAISEYLFEESEFAGFEGGQLPPDPENEAQLKAIQKAVRRTLTRMALAVGAAVLALVTAGALLLPGIVDEFYYQPDDVVAKNPENEQLSIPRMSMDLAVFSELFLPGAFRDTVYAEGEGFGRYAISIPQMATMDGHHQTVNGRLVRGKLTLYDTDTLKVPASNVFTLPENIEHTNGLWDVEAGHWVSPWGGPEDAARQLETLEEDRYYLGFVSLQNVMDYEAFYRWYEQNEPSEGNAWCAVYTEADGVGLTENIGFLIRASGFCRDHEPEKYPYLSILSLKNPPDRGTEAQMRRHFLSLLDYQLENPKLARMLAPGQTPTPEMLSLIRAGVEEQGLRIYGFTVYARKAQLEKLLADPLVYTVYAQPAG